jgi:hypothetical protein
MPQACRPPALRTRIFFGIADQQLCKLQSRCPGTALTMQHSTEKFAVLVSP